MASLTKPFPCKCNHRWIKASDANCFHAEWLWVILRVFRSQIEGIYPRLKGDYAFDCASACRCGNHPTISKDLDANHFNYKASDSYFGSFISCVWQLIGNATGQVYCMLVLCTRIPYTQLRKVAVAFIYKCQLQRCELDKLSAWPDTRRARKHMLLFIRSPFYLTSAERHLHMDVSALCCDIQTSSL